MEWKVIFAQSVTVVFSTMLIIFIGARLFSCLSLNPSEHGILTNYSCTVAIGSFKALVSKRDFTSSSNDRQHPLGSRIMQFLATHVNARK